MEEEEQQQRSLESFLRWAAELGISDATISNQPQYSFSSLGYSLCVSHFPHSGGRGLGAVRDLRRGELILRVPKSALMTTENIMEDKKLSLAVNNHPYLLSAQILIICLLYEMGKGKSSKWHPYLVHLPHSYDILATFGEFEKQALQVDEAQWVTEKAVLKAKSEWKEANALMDELKLKSQLLTFKAWLWATATISSRTLHIPWDEAGCLCPVGDLFNYDAPGKEPPGPGNEEFLLSYSSNSSIHVNSASDADDSVIVDTEQLDSLCQRLTDGGFEEDVNSYCFYARKNYKQGEQISSRTLHIPWDEAGCLCPVGDLFNYDAPGKEPPGPGNEEFLLSYSSNSSIHVNSASDADDSVIVDTEQLDSLCQRLTDGGFEEDVNSYCFYARKNYKQGEQVLLCYGLYTNLELLEHYGFLLQENPNDKIFIPLESAVYSSSSWPKESLYIDHNGNPSFALLSALRLWATPKNKRRSVGHLAYSGSQLSAENEIFVMKWLSKTCTAALKSLPTSVDEDTLLLNAMDNSQDFSSFMEITKPFSIRDEIRAFLESNNMLDGHDLTDRLVSRKARRSMDRWKLAVQWRLRYKKVLVNCISYCNEILDSLLT